MVGSYIKHLIIFILLRSVEGCVLLSLFSLIMYHYNWFKFAFWAVIQLFCGLHYTSSSLESSIKSISVLGKYLPYYIECQLKLHCILLHNNWSKFLCVLDPKGAGWIAICILFRDYVFYLTVFLFMLGIGVITLKSCLSSLTLS